MLRVAEVDTHSRAKEVIRNIPADGSPSQRTGEAFTCRIWVKDALMALCEQGVIALPADIDALEYTAVQHGLSYAPYSEGGHGATVINDAF
ncbi:hypothetical protein NUW58_g5186 [Xylaria curta]|uniref:Uncharacterized protein n=1 Tax=Xylaria curta TaxID=42375 RepID=A0ACC1P3D3_9PEZI|nr:hypothetical protein NUW58_g5186 [Xylaria curta]